MEKYPQFGFQKDLNKWWEHCEWKIKTDINLANDEGKDPFNGEMSTIWFQERLNTWWEECDFQKVETNSNTSNDEGNDPFNGEMSTIRLL
jgi:hypothetical protein